MRPFRRCVLATSSALLALPVVALVLVLHFALRDDAWRREWLWTFDLLAFSVMLTGPVLAGVAAWEGARWARCRSLVTIAERTAAAVCQYVLAMAIWVVVLYGIAVAALAAAVVSGPVSHGPSLGPLMMVPPLIGMLTAELAFGFGVGWWTGRGVVAPLVAVAVFVVTLVGYGVEPAPLIEIGGATSPLLGLAARSGLQLAQAAFWLALTWALVATIVWATERNRRHSLVVALIGWVAAAASAATAFDFGTVRFVEVAVDARCEGARPEICLSDGYQDLRPRLTGQIAAMYAALGDAGVELPARVAQVPFATDDTDDTDDTGDSDAGDRDDVMYLGAIEELTTVDMVAVVTGAVVPENCDPLGAADTYAAYADLAYWFGRELGQSVQDPTVARELTGDDRGAALAIVRQRVETLAACGA